MFLATSEHIQGITSKSNTYTKKTDLNVNANQSKFMSINTKKYYDLPVEKVEDFTNLGSIRCKDNGPGKDIKARLSKEWETLARLYTIWTSNQYNLRNKLYI